MPSLRLAVVGAGAAGLAAARELRREGHVPVVFERAAAVGGTWLYATPAPAAATDPLGAAATHSSLYASLRTNLPREVMGFLDFPFTTASSVVDGRRFPGHQEVLRYLEDFARHFNLYGLVRFETEVIGVRREAAGRWAVTSRKLGVKGKQDEEMYDAVVVCNGHYTEPRIASIPGADAWPGKQMHSHNYRVPGPFLDQVVIVIGASASAVDISRDIASVAKEVHIADRSAPASTCEQEPGYDNMWLHSMVNTFFHGELNMVVISIKGATIVSPDYKTYCYYANMFYCRLRVHGKMAVWCSKMAAQSKRMSSCTVLGIVIYLYDFPFLGDDSTISVDDNRVDPLYKHVFPIEVAPDLSFIGLPWKVIPFPLFELQSKWVAGVMSGRIKLPSKDEMIEDVKAIYLRLETHGWPKRYTHNFGGGYQFEYDDWLAEQCGHPPIEEWRKLMYAATSMNKAVRPESYRDEWDDDHLVAQANEDFKKYL
ncbi:unnamed protein product [Alopecurus aequalis]